MYVEHNAEQILVVVAIIQLMNTGEDKGSSYKRVKRCLREL